MKKNVSLKLFCTVVWRGFCQAMKQLAKLFGYQGTDRYMKVVWRITAGSFCTLAMIVSILLLYGFITEIVLDEWYKAYKRLTYQGKVYEESLLSNDIVFQKMDNKGKKTKIVNLVTGEITIKDVEHVYISKCTDSLAVFIKDNKRGYLNRFTGKVVIPAKYSRAWIFSEGLAAVVEKEELKFIDHTGKTVISKGFAASGRDNEYIFKNGYCLVRDKISNMLGAIDTSGNWVIHPTFSFAMFKGDHIIVTKGERDGLYNNKLEVLLPLEYRDITINLQDKTILARKGTDAPKLYDLNMNLLSDFVISEINQLIYDSNEGKTYIDNDGNECSEKIYLTANCNTYTAETPNTRPTYGLISPKGKIITPPIYKIIEAIGPDRYLCSPHGIVLDDKGNEVE